MTSTQSSWLRLADGGSQVDLTIGVDPALGANELRVCASAAARLAGVERDTETVELRRVPYFQRGRCPDNPLLGDETKASLDERGIVRVGATLCPGDVLVSAVEEFARPRRGRSKLKKGEVEVRDDSWRTGPGDPARVEAVRVTKDEVAGEVGELIEVDLAIDRPLETGDILLHDGEVLGAVTRISESVSVGGIVVDVAIGRAVAVRLGEDSEDGGIGPQSIQRARESAAWRLQPRSTGPCSLITGQPLNNGRGAVVHASHVAWLAERGMSATIAELAVRKSDEARESSELRELIEQGASLPAVRAPQTLHYLSTMLRGLGFNVSLDDGEGHVVLRLSPSTSEEIRAGAAGEVFKPETFEFRSLRPIAGGLFCEEVFGSEIHRVRRWGSVSLAKPVIPWHWRRFSSVLSDALKLSAEDIEAVLSGESDLSLEGSRSRLVAVGEGSKFGAEAIREALEGRALPDGLALDQLILDAVPVIPTGYRPVVLLANGNLATADLNDLYRRLINRNNRLRKLIELDAPAVIIRNESKLLQFSVDQVFACRLLKRRSPFLDKRPLWDLTQLASATAASGAKSVDWSATGRVVAKLGLSPQEVGVPARALNELRLSPGDPVLLTAQDSSSGVCRAAAVVKAEGSAFQLAPAGLVELGLGDSAVSELALHRPLGDEATRELRALLAGRLAPSPRSWTEDPIHCGESERFLERVTAAAQSGEPLSLNSPVGLLIGGLGSTDFGEESHQEQRTAILKRSELHLYGG